MNKLSQVIILALAILGGLFIVLTVFFAIQGNDSEPVNSSNTFRDDTEVKPAVRNTSDYIGYTFEEAFMGGCIGEGALASDCQCMFDYLDNNMTNEELLTLSNSDNMEQNPMFNKALNSCI